MLYPTCLLEEGAQAMKIMLSFSDAPKNKTKARAVRKKVRGGEIIVAGSARETISRARPQQRQGRDEKKMSETSLGSPRSSFACARAV